MKRVKFFLMVGLMLGVTLSVTAVDDLKFNKICLENILRSFCEKNNLKLSDIRLGVNLKNDKNAKLKKKLHKMRMRIKEYEDSIMNSCNPVLMYRFYKERVAITKLEIKDCEECKKGSCELIQCKVDTAEKIAEILKKKLINHIEKCKRCEALRTCKFCKSEPVGNNDGKYIYTCVRHKIVSRYCYTCINKYLSSSRSSGAEYPKNSLVDYIATYILLSGDYYLYKKDIPIKKKLM